MIVCRKQATKRVAFNQLCPRSAIVSREKRREAGDKHRSKRKTAKCVGGRKERATSVEDIRSSPPYSLIHQLSLSTHLGTPANRRPLLQLQEGGVPTGFCCAVQDHGDTIRVTGRVLSRRRLCPSSPTFVTPIPSPASPAVVSFLGQARANRGIATRVLVGLLGLGRQGKVDAMGWDASRLTDNREPDAPLPCLPLTCLFFFFLSRFDRRADPLSQFPFLFTPFSIKAPSPHPASPFAKSRLHPPCSQTPFLLRRTTATTTTAHILHCAPTHPHRPPLPPSCLPTLPVCVCLSVLPACRACLLTL